LLCYIAYSLLSSDPAHSLIYKNTKRALHRSFNTILQTAIHMSSAISAILYNLQQTNIYLGISILVAGLIGNALCVIVFMSLRTFRNNPCSFYLTCGTFVNIGQLLTGFLTRIMLSGFALDLTSLSCICLATIDQFVATSTRTSWQQMSNLKLAHRLVIVTSIIWSLHGIPYAITSDIENGSCIIYNTTFLRYYTHNFIFQFFLVYYLY